MVTQKSGLALRPGIRVVTTDVRGQACCGARGPRLDPGIAVQPRILAEAKPVVGSGLSLLMPRGYPGVREGGWCCLVGILCSGKTAQGEGGGTRHIDGVCRRLD